MVAYLQKSKGSEGFHQIVDFLNFTHIKYALTENPIINVLLIHQFWETAFASTSENKEMEITATIDGKVKIITKASIRRHLKLADSDGINTLPNIEIFEQLALMGFIQIFLNKHKRQLLPHKRTHIAPTLTHKLFSNMRRASKGYNGVDIPLFQTMLVQGQTLQGEGSTIPVESYHTPNGAPSTSQPPTSSPSMPTTHVAEEATTLPHDSIPRVHSLGSDKGSMTLNELTVLCTQLSIKVASLEQDLKQIKKGRKIAQMNEDEGITLVQIGAQTQERNDEDLLYETGVYDYPEGFTGPSVLITTAEPVTTVDEGVSIAGEGVSTASAIHEVSTATPRTPPTKTTVFDDEDVTMAMAQTLIKMKEVKSKEKGVVITDVEDSSRFARSITTLQPLPNIDPKYKERDDEVALRLQAELDEELKIERERQEEASKVAIAEMFDEVQARMDADYELAARMTLEEQEKYTIKERARQQKRNQDFIPMDSEKEAQKLGKRLKRVEGSYATQKSPKKSKVMKSTKDVIEEEASEYEKEKEELRKVDAKDIEVYKLTRADGSSSYHGDTQAFLRRLNRQDLNDLYSLVHERFQDQSLKGHDLLLWGDLRMIFDPDEKDELWMNWKLMRWKLYENYGVHTLFMDGTPMEINTLVEKKYPLIKELLEKMLNLKLEAEEETKELKIYSLGLAQGNRNDNGNRGGNGYRNHNVNFRGVVRLTRWLEKMVMVFHISNCPQKYHVKYATCTLVNSALTWWNSYKRTIRVDAAYAMRWTKLIKLMTEVYYVRNEIQKMETELMVPDEEDKVERFIGGLPDNIQGNVIVAEPTRLQDAIRIANNLMDQKLKAYARNAENKRRFDNNPRDNHGQHCLSSGKMLEDRMWQELTRPKTMRKRGYVGSLPYYNKYKLHHEGLCTIKCGNGKRVGHMARDCMAVVAPNTQRTPVRNRSGVIRYECERPGHYRKDCPELRN
ncbi:putative reverse transcriptase domain-containing protein [Tanacetum coccineum]